MSYTVPEKRKERMIRKRSMRFITLLDAGAHEVLIVNYRRTVECNEVTTSSGRSSRS